MGVLKYVAKLVHGGKQGPANKKEKKVDPLITFFEKNVLGIMAQFSDTIKDVRVRSSTNEKIRCFRGIEEMAKLGKGSVNSALPQVGSPRPFPTSSY